IAKYDFLGNVLWAKSAGGSDSDCGNGLSTDASGNIYLTGYFQSSSVTFGGVTLVNATTTGTQDICVAKYNSSGNVMWAKSAGGTGQDFGFSLSANTLGNVFVTGGFYSSSITFGSTTLTHPSGSVDPLFIVKYDSTGKVHCADVLTSGGDDNNGVSTDKLDNAYITGDFWVSPFIVGADTLLCGASNAENIFVAKYNCDKVSAVNELNNKKSISIYPNPTSDQFYIETNTIDKLNMDIYDVNGRHVFGASLMGKSNIDVATFDEGVYTVIIKTVDGVINKKLVILH
ncbi:MAG TPA: T9SS type A sorting domain-containing protein, partial [Nitrosopumilaceae archaeon]|nr:T9SS type A sorting domain-containing protein [Nitrosopumilaceae archaeon]